LKDKLNKRIKNSENWKISHKELKLELEEFENEFLKDVQESNQKIIAINLPQFEGVLSHFTQPDHMFANEIMDRLKVIACIEKPNMIHSEMISDVMSEKLLKKIRDVLNSKNGDAQIIIKADEFDLQTALETIEERCKMAFDGIPNETRKSFENGTTIFERVLPGADRMYPDTDSAPISIEEEYIEKLGKNLPTEIHLRLKQLRKWKVPEDAYFYILRNNLMPLIELISKKFEIKPKYISTLIAHNLKHIEGHLDDSVAFNFEKLIDIFNFLKDRKLDKDIVKEMLPICFENPSMEFESVLNILEYENSSLEDIKSEVKDLRKVFKEIQISIDPNAELNWILGRLRKSAIGNIPLKELKKEIEIMLK